jgi:hypothetical protein
MLPAEWIGRPAKSSREICRFPLFMQPEIAPCQRDIASIAATDSRVCDRRCEPPSHCRPHQANTSPGEALFVSPSALSQERHKYHETLHFRTSPPAAGRHGAQRFCLVLAYSDTEIFKDTVQIGGHNVTCSAPAARNGRLAPVFTMTGALALQGLLLWGNAPGKMRLEFADGGCD